MADNNWTVDSIRPYVLTSIETFGVDRCFFATNWPVDWLWSTYDELVDAYTEIIAGFSHDEQAALFSKNAECALPHLTPAAGFPVTVSIDLSPRRGPDAIPKLIVGGILERTSTVRLPTC